MHDTCSRCGPQQRTPPRTSGRILAIRSVDGLRFRSGDKDDTYEDIEGRCPEVAGGDRGFAEIQPRPGKAPSFIFVPSATEPKPAVAEMQMSLF